MQYAVWSYRAGNCAARVRLGDKLNTKGRWRRKAYSLRVVCWVRRHIFTNSYSSCPFRFIRQILIPVRYEMYEHRPFLWFMDTVKLHSIGGGEVGLTKESNILIINQGISDFLTCLVWLVYGIKLCDVILAHQR